MARLNRISPIGVPLSTSSKELFRVVVGKELLKDIRESTNRGLALGSSSFSEQLETLTSSRVTKKKIGNYGRNKVYADPTYSTPLIRPHLFNWIKPLVKIS